MPVAPTVPGESAATVDAAFTIEELLPVPPPVEVEFAVTPILAK